MKDNNEEKDIELQIILKKDDTKIVKDLKKILSEKEVEDLYVDFGQGDIFIIQGVNYNDNSRAIELCYHTASTGLL